MLHLNTDEIITNLIDVQRNIKCLYDNINIANEDTLDKELKKQINHENELIDKLNLTETNAKNIYAKYKEKLNDNLKEKLIIDVNDNELKHFLDKYNEIVKQEKNLTNDLLLQRFENTLIDKLVDNKRIDYLINLDIETKELELLNNKIYDTQYPNEADELCKEKNKLLFSRKLLEEKNYNNDFNISDYDNELTTEEKIEEFENIISEKINSQAAHCYLFRNEDLKNNNTDFNKAIIYLKASIYLLNANELKDAFMAYEINNLNNNKISFAKICETIEETIEEKENTKENFVLQKRKAGN